MEDRRALLDFLLHEVAGSIVELNSAALRLLEDFDRFADLRDESLTLRALAHRHKVSLALGAVRHSFDTARVLASRELSELRLSIEPVNLELLVQSVAALVETEAGCAISLRSDVNSCLNRLDVALIEAALLNVFRNAVQCSIPDSPHERIMVRTRIRFDGPWVCVSVTSIGPAIRDPDVLFRPFWMGSSSSEGRGTGLFVARQISRAHGGELAVTESAPRSGKEQVSLAQFTNTFEFRFPKS
jgi:signal transduction histidine kinase